MEINKLLDIAGTYKNTSFLGRYISQETIDSFINTFPETHKSIIGTSVEKRPITQLKLGQRSIKVLMWSQMHGNETTTTKALIDFIGFLQSNSAEAKEILSQISFTIIPQLNPDGAKAYTRVNKNAVDLNRDAQDCTQPESRAFKKVYEELEPHFCFNLHDQRTIFGVGKPAKPATVSFLSPAFNDSRALNDTRERAMKLIVYMNQSLQETIPNQVGRYDDGFNLNCVGDTLQNLGFPTILFEAGHFQNDYKREETRKFIFISLLKGILGIIKNKYEEVDYRDYFKIPENKKCFYDILIKNIGNKEDSLAIQYKEVLKDNKVIFLPFLVKEIGKKFTYGHHEIDAKGAILTINSILDFSKITEIQEISLDGKKFSLNLTKT